MKVQSHFAQTADEINAHSTGAPHRRIWDDFYSSEIFIPRLIGLINLSSCIKQTLSKIIVQIDSSLRGEGVISEVNALPRIQHCRLLTCINKWLIDMREVLIGEIRCI